MATDRVLFSLLERAGQLLREGATGVYPNLTKPELLEFAATARALAASAETKVEVTTLFQRVLSYYTINGTSDIGCDVHVAAAGLRTDLSLVRVAVDFLSSEGHLYSTIDEDHHKYTMEDDALVPYQQRILDFYTEHATSDVGLATYDVAARLGMWTPLVRMAVNSLNSEGYLYSTIDDDHHKSTE